jgi:hypothetical protein
MIGEGSYRGVTNKKNGSAFGTSTACSCEDYSKELSLVVRGYRHKTSLLDGMAYDPSP